MFKPKSSKATESPRKEKLSGIFSKTLMEARKKDWDKFIENLEFISNEPTTELVKSPTEMVEELEKATYQYLQQIEILLFKRNESRILQDGKFKDWSKMLFNVILKIREYITLEELKKHNRQVLKGNLPEINMKLQKYKSNLRHMLILRKETESKPDPNLNLEIRKEWERLLKVIPLKNLVVFSLDVLKDYKLGLFQETQTGVYLKKQSKYTTSVVTQIDSNENNRDEEMDTETEKIEKQPKQGQTKGDAQSTRRKNKLPVVKQKEKKENLLNKSFSKVGSTRWIVEKIGGMECIEKRSDKVDTQTTSKKQKLLVLEDKKKNEARLKQSHTKVDAESTKRNGKLQVVDQKETMFKPKILDFSDKETQHFQCARIKKRLNAGAKK